MIAARAKNKFSFLEGKKILVVGLGITGVSASMLLKKKGAFVTATDSKKEDDIEGIAELKKASIKVEAGGHRKESFISSDMIVVSPGVDSRMEFLIEAKKKGVEVISDIELFFRLADVPVFAITGTNGKSTVTELLAEVFKNAGKRPFMGGNIGIPVTDFFDVGNGFDSAVLEVSSFHLENIHTFKPKVAVLLNITEDHLYRYDGFDDYARTKMRIFENQDSTDVAIVNAGDPVVMAEMKKSKIKSRIIHFSTREVLKEGLYYKVTPFSKGGSGGIQNGAIVWKTQGREDAYDIKGMRLSGIHNVENVMAVIAAATEAGIPKDVLLKTVMEFKGLPHRMELVAEIKGVTYVNDSKATNVGSLYKALEGFPSGEKKVVVIAGGRDKGGDYGALKEVMEHRVKLVIVIGEAKDKIAASLSSVCEVIRALSLEDAVEISAKRASTGDTVLLSPACSSFDMFKSFEHRGETFRRLVGEL
ncbi:MAG: UDP-N-acetylmuramoyl-L-alanine--D-glutamate ligase [Thermodesulfobacteriota bacterium]